MNSKRIFIIAASLLVVVVGAAFALDQFEVIRLPLVHAAPTKAETPTLKVVVQPTTQPAKVAVQPTTQPTKVAVQPTTQPVEVKPAKLASVSNQTGFTFRLEISWGSR